MEMLESFSLKVLSLVMIYTWRATLNLVWNMFNNIVMAMEEFLDTPITFRTCDTVSRIAKGT